MTNTANSIANRIDVHLNTNEADAASFAAALGIREATLRLLRTGTVKLPLAKVPAIAALMKIEPYQLLRDVIGEYEPALLQVLDAVWDRPAVTANQRRLLALYDRVAKGKDAYPVLVTGVTMVIAKDSTDSDSTL